MINLNFTPNSFLRTSCFVPSKVSLNPLWSRPAVSTAGPGFEKWDELPFYSRSPRNHVAAKHNRHLMCIVKIWQNYLNLKPISTNVFCLLKTLPLTTIVSIFSPCQHWSKYPFYTFKLQRARYSKNYFAFAQLFSTERKSSGRKPTTNRRENTARKLGLTRNSFTYQTACFLKWFTSTNASFFLQEYFRKC